MSTAISLVAKSYGKLLFVLLVSSTSELLEPYDILLFLFSSTFVLLLQIAQIKEIFDLC